VLGTQFGQHAVAVPAAAGRAAQLHHRNGRDHQQRDDQQPDRACLGHIGQHPHEPERGDTERPEPHLADLPAPRVRKQETAAHQPVLDPRQRGLHGSLERQPPACHRARRREVDRLLERVGARSGAPRGLDAPARRGDRAAQVHRGQRRVDGELAATVEVGDVVWVGGEVAGGTGGPGIGEGPSRPETGEADRDGDQQIGQQERRTGDAPGLSCCRCEGHRTPPEPSS
jgi:hypothetical protein